MNGCPWLENTAQHTDAIEDYMHFVNLILKWCLEESVSIIIIYKLSNLKTMLENQTKCSNNEWIKNNCLPKKDI